MLGPEAERVAGVGDLRERGVLEGLAGLGDDRRDDLLVSCPSATSARAAGSVRGPRSRTPPRRAARRGRVRPSPRRPRRRGRARSRRSRPWRGSRPGCPAAACATPLWVSAGCCSTVAISISPSRSLVTDRLLRPRLLPEEIGAGSVSESSIEAMPIGSAGRSEPSVATPSSLSTTSIPSVTCPNTVCLPSSHGQASAVTMKNCEPFVSGPAFAIASAPRTILCGLISSSKV